MKKIIFGSLLTLALIASIAAVRQPIYVASTTQILSGTNIVSSDGTVTQSFSTAFGAVPNVLVVQVGLNTTITNQVAATTSNFVSTTSLSGGGIKWIAVGTP